MEKDKRESKEVGDRSRKVAKPVLQESEKKFRQVIEASPVPMVISDRNGNTEFVNRKFVDLFGYTLKELPTVQDWWPLAYPDEEYRREVRERWESAVKKARREKTEMEPLETKVTCKDGSVRHVLFRFSPVDDRNLVVLDDITERKRGEEEMREMSEAAMQLVDFPPERDMYDFICEKVKQFVDEGIVAVNSIDLENDTLQVRKVLGIGEAKLKMIDKLLGRKTTSISLSGIFQEAKDALTGGRLAKVEGGLYTVLFQKFPKTVCQQIEKMVGIKGIYSIGLRRKGKLLGSVTILASKNSRVNKNVIETFVNQASIALERKQAEEALENAAAGWRTTFDSAKDLIMVLDPHFKITRANLATAKFLGRSVNELPGKTCYQLVHGTDAPPDRCPIEKMRQTKKREEAEFYLPEKDVWLSVSADPVVDKQGKLISAVHIVRDITERKRTEEQIKLKSQFLESLIEQSPLPTFVIDSNGICVMVNRAFLKAYNVPQKELVLGKNALTEPANVRQGVVKYIKEALSGKIVETPETEFVSPYEDKRMVTKSKLFPIFDATSKLTNVVVLHEDITERKRAEEAVEKERQKLFSVLDVMPAFVYLQASDYSVPYVNRRFREMFGDPGDHPCYEVFHGRKEPCDPCITLRVLETRAPQTWEWTSKDGRTYMIYEDLFPGTEGEDLVLEIGVDITQRKRAEEALRESERELRLRNQINEIFLTTGDDKTYGAVLNVVRETLNSEFGTFGYFREDGAFVTPAITREIYWDKCRVPDKGIIFEKGTFRGVWAEALKQKKILYSNNGPFNTPEGHIPVRNTIVAPVIYRNNVISAIHLANKPTGYDEKDKVLLGMIVDHMAPVLYARIERDEREKERKRAEDALRESEKRLKEAQRVGALGDWEFDVETQQIIWSDEVYRLFERDPASGPPTFEENMAYYYPEDSIKLQEQVRRAVEFGEEFDADYRLKLPSGKALYHRGIIKTQKDESGRVTKLYGTVQDITERKRAEEALRLQSEIVANMSEGVYLVRASDGVIAYANPKFEELFGYGPGEMVGKHVSIVNAPSDESPEETAKKIMGIMQERGCWQGEIKNIKKDGTPFWCYASVSMFDHPEHGEVLVAVHTDITEHKRAEEALRESEEKYRKLFETETDAIMVFDAQTRQFVDVNDAAVRLYGYSREEFLKLKHPDITAEPDKSEVSIEQTLGGELTKIPFRYHKKKDGTIFPVEISASSFVLRGRKVLCGVIRDITEREKLREQLIQSEKLAAVGTLAYGIAHEFNNILAGMMVNAELGGDLTDNPEIKECFDSIVENAGRGSSITNSLLAVAGERKEKKELLDLTRPLENILSFSRRELEKANIKVVEDFRPIPEILCDPGQFSEVYLNIINNARDAMQPEGGTLTVNVRPYKDNIRIVFKDTGCGIPDEIKNKIFDPFVTTKGALGKSEVPGTGLGLFLTYGIVNSYRGRIEVESETGKGTTFTILIPVSRNLPSEAPPKIEAVLPGKIDRRLNILLIDDEKTICNVLKRFLESKGHKVTTSLEGSEGFEHFKKDKFDVVLSDITMPGMDGIELIKLMREKDKDSKIIAITGHVQQQKLDEAKDAGAQEVLIKPFRNAELYETIARLLLETARKDYSGTGTEHKDQNLT